MKTLIYNNIELKTAGSFDLFGENAYIARTICLHKEEPYISNKSWSVYLIKNNGETGTIGVNAPTKAILESLALKKIADYTKIGGYKSEKALLKFLLNQK